MKIELQFEFINLHKEEEPFIEYINSMQAIEMMDIQAINEEDIS